MMGMNPQKLGALLNRRLLAARVIWLGLMVSLLIYLGLGYALPLTGDFNSGASPPPAILSHILAVLGIIWAVAGVMIYSEKLPFLGKISGNNPEEVLSSALGSMILAWSLCETAGIMGLVIFLLFGDFSTLLFMCIVGAACMFIAFPGKGRFEEILRRKLGPDSGVSPT